MAAKAFRSRWLYLGIDAGLSKSLALSSSFHFAVKA